MNDERTEKELRAWLADEASRIAMPGDLRERAAAARTAPAARGGTSGWTLALPRPLLAGVAGLLLVAVGTSLLLSGVLPIGRADCSRVSVESVRSAAEAVAGYTYRMAGSELQGYPAGGGGTPLELEYVTSTFDLQGAYRAPDAWTIEIIDWEDAGAPVPPSIGFFSIGQEWDGYLAVDGLGWGRPIGSERFTPMPAGGLDLSSVGPNRLTDLLAGEPFRFSPGGAPSYQAPLTWSVAIDGDVCRLVSAHERFRASADGSWTLELVIDPATNLVTEATYRLTTPEVPAHDDGSFSSAQDLRYAFTFHYGDVPEITPPTDPDIEPVTDDQVRDAAPTEIGLVTNVVGDAIGATQLYVVRGVDGIAVMRFEEAQLADSRTVAEAEDVWVELLDGVDGRFLVVIVNDVRIEAVDVTYTRGETDEPLPERLTAGGARPIFIVRVDHPGDLADWRALDEDGREVASSQEP